MLSLNEYLLLDGLGPRFARHEGIQAEMAESSMAPSPTINTMAGLNPETTDVEISMKSIG